MVVVCVLPYFIGQDAAVGLDSVLSLDAVCELVRYVLLHCSDACRMGTHVMVQLAPATQEIPEI